MPMRLYNTLSRSEEDFRPSQGNVVRMYACGLTVYARGHIGNFRSFLSQDTLRRALRHQEGYEMRHVRNFTDVDDKTIDGAFAAGVSLREYTDRWISAFEEDAIALGLEPVEASPRATDSANMQAMTDMVKQLDARGHTYPSEGSIYFRIASFPTYGKLARLDLEGIQAGARVDNDNYSKQDARDFVLWKASKPGEPTWDLGAGPGRPGWHLECSAMALRLLGEPPIDIHCGGVDLVFPHHENEIAQAEGATGKPFVRFWVHTEFLNLDNEKMSKSLGNVFSVRDVLDRGYRASALRYLLISVHYRKQLLFNWDGLDAAEAALTRLADFLARLAVVKGGVARPEIGDRVARARADFREMIAADLNVPGALGVLFELLREMNAALDAGAAGEADARGIREVFDECDRVLGVLALREAEDARPPMPVEEIDALITERRDAKRTRNFARADTIRTELEARGILLEDTVAGTRWKRK
jgi:cysteinyl-tRNA synthetase